MTQANASTPGATPDPQREIDDLLTQLDQLDAHAKMVLEQRLAE